MFIVGWLGVAGFECCLIWLDCDGNLDTWCVLGLLFDYLLVRRLLSLAYLLFDLIWFCAYCLVWLC